MNSTINRRLQNLESKSASTITAETRAEVAHMVEAARSEYDTPAARATRKAEYAERLRIGELRRRAYFAGESWDAIPLPDPKIDIDNDVLEKINIKLGGL